MFIIFHIIKILHKYDKYLCNKCVIIEREKTCIKKYGVKHTSLLKETHEKRKETNLEKYGNEKFVNIDKRIETNLEKYGTEYALSNKEVRERIIKTNLEKYGSESNLSNIKIREKIKKTNLERYGVEYPQMNKDIKLKQTLSMLKTKRDNQIKKYSDIIEIDYQNNEYTCLCDKCNTIYNINSHLYLYRMNFYNTEPCVKCNKINDKFSNIENELYLFIEDNYSFKN